MKTGSWRNVTLAHGPMQRWFTKKQKKNVTCCRPSHSAQRFQLFNQEKNQWKWYKDLHLSAKPGWELTPAPITPCQQGSSPLQCKGPESRNCPHPVHQRVPQTKITRHTVATLLVEWQMNFMEDCGGTHCANRRKKAKIYCIIRLFKSGGGGGRMPTMRYESV